MREVEKQISELKDAQFKKLVKPVDAFVTFEEEDGAIVGQEFEPAFSFWGKRLPASGSFLGEDLFLVEAPEPTNIIWENRHWTARDYLKRSMVVFSVISVLVFVSFGLIYLCKSYSITLQGKYP